MATMNWDRVRREAHLHRPATTAQPPQLPLGGRRCDDERVLELARKIERRAIRRLCPHPLDRREYSLGGDLQRCGDCGRKGAGRGLAQQQDAAGR